jgi:hypothetical protein
MFVLNIAVTGVLQSCSKKVGNQIEAVDAAYLANHSRHTNLIRERQELARRDRIVSYAQNNLGMRLLRADEIASGNIIKEIREEEARSNIVYAFIDFITPSLNAFENRR